MPDHSCRKKVVEVAPELGELDPPASTTFTQIVPFAGNSMGSSQATKSPSLSCRNKVACPSLAKIAAFTSSLVSVGLTHRHGAVSSHGAALLFVFKYLTFLSGMACSNSPRHVVWHSGNKQRAVAKYRSSDCWP